MHPLVINQPLPSSRDRLPKRKAAENHLLNRLKIVEEEEEEEEEEEAEDDVEDEDDFYEVLDSEEYGSGPLSGGSNLDPTSVFQDKAALPPSPMSNEAIPFAKAKGKRGRQAVQPRKARKRTARQRDEEPESDHDGESDGGSNITGGKHTNVDILCNTQLYITILQIHWISTTRRLFTMTSRERANGSPSTQSLRGTQFKISSQKFLASIRLSFMHSIASVPIRRGTCPTTFVVQQISTLS